jgi:outer membrane receptor protein involved in Fe transport
MDTEIRGLRTPSRLVATAVALAIASWAGDWNQAQAAEEEELAEVTVTGSRIVRRDYESQSPIVTVGQETFENRSAVTVEAALQQLPQFAPSASAQANSGSSTAFPGPTVAPGAATANLRGLGSNRNLVLVDGRRVQPINGNLTVDLNTIPSAAIQNVEVISGGAAAVYGADAISGVINLILKKNFEGAQFDAQYGLTEAGDGEQYQFSALLGANYGDGRGNVMFGGSYAYRGKINGKDRDWVRAGWLDPGTPAGGASNVDNLSLFRCTRAGAAIGTCSNAWLPVQNGSGYSVDRNGNVYDANDPLNPAHPYTGPISYESGYKMNPNGSLGYFDKDASALAVPLERYALFASTNYKLNDHLEFFTDARFTKTFTVGLGTHVSLFNIWAMNVPYNQAYDDPDSPTFGQAPTGTAMHPVPRGLADILNARNVANPTTAPWLYEGGVDYLPRYRTEATTNVFQLIAGLRGDLPVKDWTWEVYGSHGDTNVESYLPESFLSMANMQVLFNANQYGQGWVNPQTLTVTGSCPEGLPIFNPDGSVDNTPSVSQQCADWATLRMNNTTNLSQEILEGSIQGTLFDAWAGPVQFAAGGTYRAEVFKFTPDAAYNAVQATANVVNNIALPLGVNGRNHVSELYGELAIPLLTDLPFVKKLEIDPGYRISDYKTSGSISTWKVTGVWQLIDWFTLRGGFQKATRAPNLNELFMPVGAASIQGSIDGCGNWANSPTWANVPGNTNRLNVQILCEHLMQRDGAPTPFPLYVPGGSANTYAYTVFGANNPTAPFNFDLGIQGGNPNLDPEKADTITAGLVLKSPFDTDLLRRLTLSVDYYDIDLKGAIGVPTGSQVYQQCLNAQFNPLIGDAAGSHTGAELAAGNPYCDLIRREYTGLPSGSFGADRRYMATYVNLGGIKTSGVDVQLDWGVNLGFVPGMFTTNIQYNKLNEFKQSPFAGAPFTERKGTWDAGYNYDWQLLSTFGYSNGPYSVGLRWSHKPGLNPPSSASSSTMPVESYDLLDLFGRWAINERYEVRAGIDNLLDKDPGVFNATRVVCTAVGPGCTAVGAVNTAASNNALGSSVVGQDTFGRRYFLAVKVSL